MAIRIMTALLGSVDFFMACEAVGIPPTRRQWKKWRIQKGKAWKEGRQ